MKHLDLDTIVLSYGSHSSREVGVSLMEAVAWWANEPHTDRPACTSPILATFATMWNDGLRDEERQQLRQYIPLLIGTAGILEADERRAWMAFDWTIRTYLVAWFRLSGMVKLALDLEQSQPITGPELIPMPLIEAAWANTREAAEKAVENAEKAARGAAGASAGDAAWKAAGAGAWAAVWKAGDVGWKAGGAGASVREVAGNAARDAALAAAGFVAGAAAWASAGGATWATVEEGAWKTALASAGAAARKAAGAALEPTVVKLQASAHDLFRRMITA